MDWYLAVLRKYAVFEGRARRKEYWMFTLFNAIFGFIPVLIMQIMSVSIAMSDSFAPLFWIMAMGAVSFIYCLAVFVPTMAVSVRRLHDIGKSGWYMFIVLIPIIGPIWYLVLLCIDSDPGQNKYGPNPKQNEYENPAYNNVNTVYPPQPQMTSSQASMANTSSRDFKFCPQCGTRNKIKNAFCSQCGFKIPVREAVPPPPVAPEYDASPVMNTDLSSDFTPSPAQPSEEMDDATQLLQPPVVPVLRIANVNDDQENTMVIDKPEFVIGRNQEAVDYTVKDNNNIGRTHAKIISREGFYYIIDLDSKNGTFINETQVESGVETPIQFGDVIKLANQDFVFEKV